MNLTDKKILMETLTDANRRVTDWFAALPAAQFFQSQADAWSASENLDHLIRAVKPVTLGLKMPGLALQGRFGRPDHSSRSYEEICKVYREEIANGAQASGRYLPEQEDHGDTIEVEKKRLLETWKKASQELVSAAQKWDESDLDTYQMPHPILGKLTVREMLFFTIYHNLRHASQEGD